MSAASREVLFIGLGAMGGPVAANLVRHGGARLSGLDTGGATLPDDVAWTPVASASEATGPDTVVFLCLPSIREVRQVCEELLASTPRPRCVVDLSTSDPEETRELAARLEEAGVAFLDAPIARGRDAAASGDLLMMVGGEADLIAELRPLLDAVASDVVHCGPIGSGQVVKILNNMVLMMNVHALDEAVAVAASADLDVPTVLSVLSKGSAGSFALSGDPGAALAGADFPTGKFAVDYALKDVRLARGLARSAGLDALRGLAATEELLAAASAEGLGTQYYPAAVQALLGRRVSGSYRSEASDEPDDERD